jgi:hypothetical protein
MTVLTLCYWLCDDGSFCKSTQRVFLCTECYSVDEVSLLIKVLNAKWDLKCRKVKRGSGYRIVIPGKSLPRPRSPKLYQRSLCATDHGRPHLTNCKFVGGQPPKKL